MPIASSSIPPSATDVSRQTRRLRIALRHVERAAEAVAVGSEELTGEGILGPGADSDRGSRLVDSIDEAHVAPGAGPVVGRVDVGIVFRAGIQREVRPSLLVADERPVVGVRAVDARLVPRLPVDFVPAPEEQVDAGVARRLDIRALVPRPVFVMADRQIGLVPSRRSGRGGRCRRRRCRRRRSRSSRASRWPRTLRRRGSLAPDAAPPKSRVMIGRL